jgi:serine/threonine-protein kinase
LSVPRLIANRYEIRSRIGEGNFSITYRATDTVLGRDVAIKVLREQYVDHPGFAARFENEARAAALVSNPSVVPVFDFGREGKTAYIVMQYVAGPTLKDYIREEGPLTVEEAIEFTRQILDGLAAIHDAGIVHRDVKPQNVLLTETRQAKLTDFGIARMAVDSYLTGTGTAIGTAAYMAPEQASGSAVGPQADLYSVGVILYEMLTSRLPFPGDNPVQVMYRHVNEFPPPPRTINRAIPIALESFVLRTLSKDPEDRYPDARAMRTALLDPAADMSAIRAGPRVVDPNQSTAINRNVIVRPPQRRAAAVGAPPRVPPRGPRRPPARARRNPWPVILPLMALVGLGLVLGAIAFAGDSNGDGIEPTLTLPAVGASPTDEPTATAEQATATLAATVAPTDTPAQPTATPEPPTATPEPPTPTPEPPTATPEPPTPTLEPETPTPEAPTATPEPDASPTAPPAGFNQPFPAGNLPGSIANGPRVDIPADSFSGGYRREDGVLYGRPAVHLYGQGSGADVTEARFVLDAQPEQYIVLEIVGLDDESTQHVPIQVLLNGNVIWRGQSPFRNANVPEDDPSAWTRIAWQLNDLTFAQQGENTLTIVNLGTNGEIGSPPWVLVNSASVYYQ